MCRFFLVISGTPSNPEAQSPPPSPPPQIKTLNWQLVKLWHHCCEVVLGYHIK